MTKAEPAVPAILEQFRTDIDRCVKCGSCRAVCPPFLSVRRETFSARGRIALIRAVAERRLPVTAVFEDRIASCTSCLACQSTCASSVPVAEIIQAARRQAAAELGAGVVKTIIARVLTSAQAMRAGAWLAPLALHYNPASIRGGARQASRNFRVPGQQEALSGRKRKIVLYPGCGVNYFQPDVGFAALTVLNSLGYTVIVPEGLQCCGRPLLSVGAQEAAQKNAEQNARVLAECGESIIVTACASCSLTFKKEYPKLLPAGARMPAVLDIHEFLAGETDNLKMNAIGRTITWHDPCHLGRGQGLAAAARDILRKIPGLILVEMANPDRCCGFGGVMRVTHAEISDAIAQEKVKSILATGAASVVTGCPSCRMQITDGLRRAGSALEVLHTVQVLRDALVARSDRYASSRGRKPALSQSGTGKDRT